MVFLEPGDPEQRAKEVAGAFEAAYDAPPTVVGIAPGRVNLIGEHTDYNAGLCLPLALPHVTWAAARSTSTGRLRISSAQQSDSWDGPIAEIGPGQVDGWVTYVAGVVWALREDGIGLPGLDLHLDSAVPLGAGLSSSAALECAVAVAVTTLAGRDLDESVRRALVAACIRAETEVARAPTGGMDQTVAMLGTLGHGLLIDFEDGSSRAVPLDLDSAGLTLLVTDTRVSHALVDGGYGDRRSECESAAAALGVTTLRVAEVGLVEGLADPTLRRRARHVVTENARVLEVEQAFAHRDWAEVGSAMVTSHRSMRDDFEISCPELDLAVETALASGALGARMTGGGFGGSSVALVPRDRVQSLAAAVDTAFAAAGMAPPTHLIAVPSAGARTAT